MREEPGRGKERNSINKNIEQPEPLDKQDPTGPVTVGSGKGSSGREGKASGGATGS
jgi:hypothetical protein